MHEKGAQPVLRFVHLIYTPQISILVFLKYALCFLNLRLIKKFTI